MNKKIKNISQKVMAVTLTSSMVFIPVANASAQTYNTSQDTILKSADEIMRAVSLLESKGDLESASIEWKAVNKATGYNVYYKKAGSSDYEYKKLDNNLIRKYPSYFRADAVGLAAGNYVLKVVPIINGQESKSEETITRNIEVKANVREGFAFSKESEMGTGSGGYNNDGTVPQDATVLYVTKDTANTVTADVITSKTGTKTTVTGITNILAARQKGYDKSHLIIRVIGKINAADINGLNSNGYLQLKGCYNVTLEGVGEDATAYGWGILVRDSHNVEVRNLGLMLFPDDGISLDTNNKNIWVHNNDIFYGAAGSDKDQVKGDGSCDTKKSDYVTIAYNHFYDSGKSSLCGMSDTEEFRVSYHHNWFDHSDSRHPRIRVGTIHVYNNYFDGNAKYGVGVTKGSSAFVEANVFRNCKYPMLTSMQGTDVYNGSVGTFSKEDGGMIKAYNNSITGAARVVYANEDSKQFDAYLAKSRNEVVPESYKTIKGENKYNNFDTKGTMYNYKPDSVDNVVNNVTTYAGRVGGGDFVWKFTTADDTDYSVNQALMDKIKNYKSDLVSVGGLQVKLAAERQITNENEDSIQTLDAEAMVKSVTSNGMNTNLFNAEDSKFKSSVYVSTNGSSSNDGSLNKPVDLATALEKVNKGECKAILLKEGTYKFDNQITINASGTKDAYNVLKAAKGANVVLDFSSESYNAKDTSKNARGIQMNGNYWYMSGITIKGAADNGMMLSGSHNIIERCIFDGNRDTGLQISRRSSAVTNFDEWPSYNNIINCTSKNNCDPATYENADGFAAKLTCGNGNVFDGCMAYNNSDDGWDLFAKSATGSTGVVTIRNCIAMRNGITENGTTKSSCDGNGFKLGGSGVPTPHVVTNCIAIENLHHGFTDNNNPAALKVTNCTAFNNNIDGGKNNFSLYRCKDAVVSNCISYTTNGTSDKFVSVFGDHIVFYNSKKWYKVNDSQAVNTGSSTSRGEVLSKGTTASDFTSVDVPKVGTDFDKVWRNQDGTINTKGTALVSGSSAYSKFSTDGGAIGARFTSNNKLTSLTVNVK